MYPRSKTATLAFLIERPFDTPDEISLVVTRQVPEAAALDALEVVIGCRGWRMSWPSRRARMVLLKLVISLDSCLKRILHGTSMVMAYLIRRIRTHLSGRVGRRPMVDSDLSDAKAIQKEFFLSGAGTAKFQSIALEPEIL